MSKSEAFFSGATEDRAARAYIGCADASEYTKPTGETPVPQNMATPVFSGVAYGT
jgi:hypothetical protein